jgi:hypothetical protein
MVVGRWPLGRVLHAANVSLEVAWGIEDSDVPVSVAIVLLAEDGEQFAIATLDLKDARSFHAAMGKRIEQASRRVQ